MQEDRVAARGPPGQRQGRRRQREARAAFAGQPQVQAQLPPRIPYGVPAVGADALIPAAAKADLPTTEANIATALHINDAFWLENIDRLTQRFNAWAAR